MSQQEFDFEDPAGQQRRVSRRAAQRRDIERLEIPKPPPEFGRRPSIASCKAVLLVLDDAINSNEAWRLKATTIAEKCGFRSRHTVYRALAWLEELGFISQTKTGRSVLFSMNRSAIAEAVRDPQKNGARSTSRRAQKHQQMVPEAPADGARSTSRRAQKHHQMVPEAPSTLPPPLPLHTTTPFTWAAAVEVLNSLGIYGRTLHQLTAELKAKSDPERVLELVGVWREAGGGTDCAAWQEGALVNRLRFDTHEDPRDGWPPPSAEYQRHQNRNRRHHQHAEAHGQAAADRQRAEADRRQLADLEQQWGPTLDRMPEAERTELAADLFASDFERSQYRRTWQEPGSWSRSRLLERIAARAPS